MVVVIVAEEVIRGGVQEKQRECTECISRCVHFFFFVFVSFCFPSASSFLVEYRLSSAGRRLVGYWFIEIVPTLTVVCVRGWELADPRARVVVVVRVAPSKNSQTSCCFLVLWFLQGSVGDGDWIKRVEGVEGVVWMYDAVFV
jgi:hypothetical protein